MEENDATTQATSEQIAAAAAGSNIPGQSIVEADPVTGPGNVIADAAADKEQSIVADIQKRETVKLTAEDLDFVISSNFATFQELLAKKKVKVVPISPSDPEDEDEDEAAWEEEEPPAPAAAAPKLGPNDAIAAALANAAPVTHDQVAPPAPRHPVTGQIIDADEAKQFEPAKSEAEE